MARRPSTDFLTLLLSYVYPYPLHTSCAPDIPALAKVIWVFYRHSRETNLFLRSNSTVSRNKYIRILILASIDLVLTLPFGIIYNVLAWKRTLEQREQGSLAFYQGWDVVHAFIGSPVPYRLAELDTWSLGELYYSQWTSPVLALAIIALFGGAEETRCAVAAAAHRLGWGARRGTQRCASAGCRTSGMHFARPTGSVVSTLVSGSTVGEQPLEHGSRGETGCDAMSESGSV